jgi:hypothetical protein
MNRKQFAATTVLFIGVSLPVLAVDQKPANSEQRYVPRLSDIMVATQLRHFKLWYAGIVQNSPLANYELAQTDRPFPQKARRARYGEPVETVRLQKLRIGDGRC